MLGVNALVLVLPIAAIATLRIYDTYLIRQTERSLIAQSVVIGEIYRDLLHEEQGVPGDPADFRPPEHASDAFVPIEPVLAFRIEKKPPVEKPLPLRTVRDDAERRAGARMEALLKRSQVFNLTGVRVLDSEGCVVSTSRTEADVCMGDLPEVQKALRGRYGAVARERVSDEPTPAIGDVRSRGKIRIFSAMPVFENGQVIAVVRASRTSLDALTSLWQSRRGLLIAIAISLSVTLGISVLFATLVARPVKALTNDAIAITNDAPRLPLRLRWWTPHELRTLAAALDDMTTTLRERADYISAFAATVSHELKTPITAIRGAAELLTDQWSSMSETQRARFLHNIDFDAERMQRLVTGLLHLARIENAVENTIEANGETHLHEAITALTTRHGDKVRVIIDDDVPPTVAMPDELFTSAVSNLVDNAVRHGGHEPVMLHVHVDGQHLCVDVTDKGPGISPANQAKIFERFFTTERARGGTGLGLTIVRAIARRRGGDVTFVTGNSGTTFTLRAQLHR